MILDSMIIRLQVRCLLAALAVLTVLFLVVDLFDSARYLFGPQATTADVVMLYVYKLPAMLHLLLPISLVVGTCVAFARLGQYRELRALVAAGLGPVRLVRPVLVVSAVTAAVVVLLGELAVPPAYDRIETLMSERFGRFDSSWRFFRSHRWVKGDEGRLIRVSRKSSDGGTLRGVVVFELDEDFHMVRRTDAARVVWREGSWIARGVEERRFADGRLVSYDKKAEKVLDWSMSPRRFRDLSGRPQQKNFAGLAETIEELKRRGIDAAEYHLAMHNRFAYPLIALALVLLFFPWMSAPHRRPTVSGALIEAIGLVFCAYFLAAVAAASVSNGLLAPVPGAWLPPAVIGLFAVPRWLRLAFGARTWRTA